MMSLEAIHSMSRQAAREASKSGTQPYVPFDGDEIDKMPPFPFPFLGTHCPKGWKKVGEPLFCDSSGFGDEREPALSIRRLKIILKDNLQFSYGYGIVEAGQFQCYVQAFKRKP